MDDESFKLVILEIINDLSGGCKFTELLSRVMEELHARGEKINGSLPENLERIIRGMPELKVLEYTWKTTHRTKMFIYTP